MDFLPVAKTEKKEESIFDIIKTVLVVVFVVLVVRTFAFEPFNIPSGSMIPTLLVGDYVVVSKYSYGYSKYSFPFYNPPITGRIFGKLPERGDVAVFRLPRDPSVDYIKRIIGLPGDRIQVRDSILYINDKPVARHRVDDFVDDEYGRPVPTYQFIETLPNARQHPILQRTLDGTGENDNTAVFTVPDGYFFAMGDNRNNSEDSRIPSAVGYVPMENLVGRAEFRFFSINAQAPWWQFWQWPFEIRFSRMFTGIH